ncbi:ABC transporter permease subunit [Corynebacterium sp. H78]|uniref:ABC transporter permease subunit n=1 Tax=Corynebacterium sp. H78 TaxID=3133417 RepID=UPI003098A17B
MSDSTRAPSSHQKPRWWRFVPLLIVVAFALVVPLIWPAPTADFSRALQAPSSEFIAGTDHYGFDLWTRTALGLRVSLLIGVVSALAATAIGVIVGLLAAAFGGTVDRILMRLTDAVNSIPHLILSVVIVALFRGSITALIISIAITHWTQVARVVRSTVLTARESEYVAASYGAGASRRWVLTNHLLPSAMGQAVIAVLMLVPHAVWHESALSFLGLGLQPDFPSLGTLLDQARADIMLGAWWVLVVPGIALLAASLSLVAVVPKEVLLGSSRPDMPAPRASADLPTVSFTDRDSGVTNLSITITSDKHRTIPAVVNATLNITPGTVHGLIGGSGSGKSTLGRVLCGLVPPQAKVSGDIIVAGQRNPAARSAALIPQAPALSFTPVRRLGPQLAEILRAAGRNGTDGDVVKLLEQVRLEPSAATMFPHQLSGGMAQRAAIAAALATGRTTLVADEPTSALDPQLTREILGLLRELADDGYAVLLITHDVEDVREAGVCDELSVMRQGHILEHGPAGDVLHHPQAPYTQALLAALPSGGMRITDGFERG